MSRVKNGLTRHKRHKKLLKATSGYRGRSSNCYKPAKHKYEKGLQYATAHRKLKKRDFRKLWIQRINAAVRGYGLKYSSFIDLLKKADISLDRKVLSYMCLERPEVFRSLVDQVQKKA